MPEHSRPGESRRTSTRHLTSAALARRQQTTQLSDRSRSKRPLTKISQNGELNTFMYCYLTLTHDRVAVERFRKFSRDRPSFADIIFLTNRKSATPSTSGRRPVVGTLSLRTGRATPSLPAPSWPRLWPSPGTSAPSVRRGRADPSRAVGTRAESAYRTSLPRGLGIVGGAWMR